MISGLMLFLRGVRARHPRGAPGFIILQGNRGGISISRVERNLRGTAVSVKVSLDTPCKHEEAASVVLDGVIEISPAALRAPSSNGGHQ